MKILFIISVLITCAFAASAQDNSDAAIRKRGGLTAYPDKAQKQHIVFSAYPNPATENLSIQSERPLKGFQIELLDKFGKSRIKQHSFNGQSLDLSSLEDGIYIVRLIRKKETYSRIIVIQKDK